MVCFTTEKSDTAARLTMSSTMACLGMSLKGSSTVTSLSVVQPKMLWVGAERNTGFRSPGGAANSDT